MMNMATQDTDLQAEHRCSTSLVGHSNSTALNQMIVSSLIDLNCRRRTSSLNKASYWEQMKRHAKVGQMIMMRNLVGKKLGNILSLDKNKSGRIPLF